MLGAREREGGGGDERLPMVAESRASEQRRAGKKTMNEEDRNGGRKGNEK